MPTDQTAGPRSGARRGIWDDRIKVIAAGLEAGQEIPEHPEALAVYHILKGKGQITVDGEPIPVGAGALSVSR